MGIYFSFSYFTFLCFLQAPPVSSQTSSQVDKWEKVAAPAEDRPSEQNKPTTRGPQTVPSSPLTESSGGERKGGLGLFEETDGVGSKQTKLLEAANHADGVLSGDSPPLPVKKDEKATRNTFSLFDDGEEEESDWNKPIFTSRKPNAKNTFKVCVDVFGGGGGLVCLAVWVMFSPRVSPQRSKRKPRAQGCSRTRSCCSARRSRRTTTQMWTSSPPQGKPQSVDSIFVRVYRLCLCLLQQSQQTPCLFPF